MKKKKRGKLESFVLIVAAIVSVTAALVLFLFYTKEGKRLTAKVVAGYLHDSVNYVSNKEKGEEESFGRSGKQTGNPAGDTHQQSEEKKYYHILLLGEEAIRSTEGKGRTDAIVLATIYPEQKKVILTSILRDTYVEPEGSVPCKINSVYAKQGVKGLYRILYEKLGVWPDGYMKVGFDSFERIIDLLGGAEVTLSEEEAAYLNTHNYISKEEYRNVVAGTQVLNGNQTLGYCRVRYVANYKGTKYDFGRTERQRMVLSNLFERYKAAGIAKWVKILKEALGYIETDISKETMEKLIFAVYDAGITELEQRQLPAPETYESVKVKENVTSTLVVDWEKNRELFWNRLE